jgi:hypothetical protein
LDIYRRDSPGGNQAHLAPEVLNALRPLTRHAVEYVSVDYSKQAVFETGAMLCELAVLRHAIPDYPVFVTGPPPMCQVQYDNSAICPWLSGGRASVALMGECCEFTAFSVDVCARRYHGQILEQV